MSSAASFLLSRVDAVIDPKLDALDPGDHPGAQALPGQAALANACPVHHAYTHRQRPLAPAGTGPTPSDVKDQPDPEQIAAGFAAVGIDLADIARQVEDKAVQLFQDSYAQLVDTVTAALSADGADVQVDGTSRPAGGGQTPAAPAA